MKFLKKLVRRFWLLRDADFKLVQEVPNNILLLLTKWFFVFRN